MVRTVRPCFTRIRQDVAETLAVGFAAGCPAGSAVVPAEINGIACPFALAKS